MRVPDSKHDGAARVPSHPLDGFIEAVQRFHGIEPSEPVDTSRMQRAALEDAIDAIGLALAYGPDTRVVTHLEVATAAVLDAQAVLAERGES